MSIKAVKLYFRVLMESIKSWLELQRIVAQMDREFHRQFRKGPKKPLLKTSKREW